MTKQQCIVDKIYQLEFPCCQLSLLLVSTFIYYCYPTMQQGQPCSSQVLVIHQQQQHDGVTYLVLLVASRQCHTSNSCTAYRTYCCINSAR